MTLRKVWLFVVMIISILAIGINALVLSRLTDHYFTDYLNESYALHVGQILDYTQNALSHEDVSYNRMAIDYETHLIDPIIGIRLYNPSGALLVSADNGFQMNSNMGMMNGRSMMNDDLDEITEQYEIIVDDTILAVMNISLQSTSDDSFVARKFQDDLIKNTIISVVIALLLSGIIGVFISKWMTKSLRETENLAHQLQLGDKITYNQSIIREVNAIRDRLIDLNARLKLKQTRRKSLTDQLLHQTRTPLTILKSHIEAFEDGIVDIDSKTLGVCKDQIDNINYIIANMATMIDAQVDFTGVSVDEFDIHKVLNQIVKGLKPQFEKKNISLSIESDFAFILRTDKNLLSQSIYNLLTNAYKYSDQGQVIIRYKTKLNQIQIQIEDTGVGISETDQKHIFEAYYRSNKAVTESGEGIGLYLAKSNIEKLGGSISLESKLGVGSVFSINLPMDFSKE